MILQKALARVRRARNKNTNGSLSVQIGDEHIAVLPLGVKDTIKVAILMAPYVTTFNTHAGTIANAIVHDRFQVAGERSTLRALVAAMMADVDHLPGDVVKMLAIFLRCEPEWIAGNTTAHQLVAAIPVIDQANDLGSLIRSTGMLGFIPGQPVGDDHG